MKGKAIFIQQLNSDFINRPFYEMTMFIVRFLVSNKEALHSNLDIKQ